MAVVLGVEVVSLMCTKLVIHGVLNSKIIFP